MATTTIRATTNSRHDEDEVMACERRVFNQYSAQQQYINNDFVRILLEILCVVVVIVHLAHAEDVSLSSPFQGVTADSLLLPDMPVTRLAFGSCNKHDRAQPFWKILIERQCQVFIWLGDIIYADIKVGILPHSRISQPPSETRKKYMTQKAEQGYRSFANTRPIIVGTWDDHDYGINDGDETYPDKDVSKQLLMEFLEEPAESVRLKRHGVYAAYTFGPPGKRVKSILLDGRYFLHADVGPEADMLGEQQWQWLEQELRNTDAQIVLIGSGVQVISDDKNIAVQAESWGRYPQSRTRIINLIKSTNTSGALFLSGDIHMAEINLMRCSPVDYPLLLSCCASSSATATATGVYRDSTLHAHIQIRYH